jgi:hypothetical protein
MGAKGSAVHFMMKAPAPDHIHPECTTWVQKVQQCIL